MVAEGGDRSRLLWRLQWWPAIRRRAAAAPSSVRVCGPDEWSHDPAPRTVLVAVIWRDGNILVAPRLPTGLRLRREGGLAFPGNFSLSRPDHGEVCEPAAAVGRLRGIGSGLCGSRCRREREH